MHLLQSLRLLGDGARSFAEKCIDGILPNSERIAALVSESLMLVTALNQKIGYDNAAKCAKKAHAEGKTLRDATIELVYSRYEILIPQRQFPMRSLAWPVLGRYFYLCP